MNQADPATPASYQWSLIKGDKGLGVKAVIPQYYLSTSNASQSGGSWTETQPAWTSNKYIWTRSKVTWDDNSVTYSDPILANSINLANDKANQAYNLANTANGNASNALNKANSAVNQANMGMDKWLVTEYDANGKTVNSISTIPLLIVSQLTPKSTVEASNTFATNAHSFGTTPRSGVVTSDEYVVVYSITYIQFSADTTISNFSFSSDDAGTLYINGAQVAHHSAYASSTGMSVAFKKGWNVIEVIFHNGPSIGDFAFGTYDSTNKVYYALDLTKLSNFERMDCYCSAFSGQTAYGLATNAKILETSSSLETVSRTVTDNKNGVKDLMTRTSQVETNVTNLKSLENTHYSTLTTQYNNQQKTIDGTVTRLGNAENRITTVSNDLSNLSIGGRNLLVNSNDAIKGGWFGTNSWSVSTDATPPQSGLTVYETNGAWNGLSSYYEVKTGETYTYSTYVKTDSTEEVVSYIFITINSDSENGYKRALVGYNSEEFKFNNEWKRVHTTFTVKSDGYIRARVERGTEHSNKIYICGMKLERGNKATDWSPAPEDFDNKITEQSTALATYKQIITKKYLTRSFRKSVEFINTFKIFFVLINFSCILKLKKGACIQEVKKCIQLLNCANFVLRQLSVKNLLSSPESAMNAR